MNYDDKHDENKTEWDKQHVSSPPLIRNLHRMQARLGSPRGRGLFATISKPVQVTLDRRHDDEYDDSVNCENLHRHYLLFAVFLYIIYNI